jgi:hypothetical protein
MPCPFHSSRFDYPNNIWWWVQVTKFYIHPVHDQCCYTLTWTTGLLCLPWTIRIKWAYDGNKNAVFWNTIPRTLADT